jgi:hypothetical protein
LPAETKNGLLEGMDKPATAAVRILIYASIIAPLLALAVVLAHISNKPDTQYDCLNHADALDDYALRIGGVPPCEGKHG